MKGIRRCELCNCETEQFKTAHVNIANTPYSFPVFLCPSCYKYVENDMTIEEYDEWALRVSQIRGYHY